MPWQLSASGSAAPKASESINRHGVLIFHRRLAQSMGLKLFPIPGIPKVLYGGTMEMHLLFGSEHPWRFVEFTIWTLAPQPLPSECQRLLFNPLLFDSFAWRYRPQLQHVWYYVYTITRRYEPLQLCSVPSTNVVASPNVTFFNLNLDLTSNPISTKHPHKNIPKPL